MHTHPHAERALVRARRVQFSSVRARSYGRPNCAARASRSPFVHSDADFVPRLGMPRRPEGAAPRKRGRPRLADDMISKAGLQKRRQRDPNEHAMTALHVALPKPADGLMAVSRLRAAARHDDESECALSAAVGCWSAAADRSFASRRFDSHRLTGAAAGLRPRHARWTAARAASRWQPRAARDVLLDLSSRHRTRLVAAGARRPASGGGRRPGRPSSCPPRSPGARAYSRGFVPWRVGWRLLVITHRVLETCYATSRRNLSREREK